MPHNPRANDDDDDDDRGDDDDDDENASSRFSYSTDNYFREFVFVFVSSKTNIKEKYEIRKLFF